MGLQQLATHTNTHTHTYIYIYIYIYIFTYLFIYLFNYFFISSQTLLARNPKERLPFTSTGSSVCLVYTGLWFSMTMAFVSTCSIGEQRNKWWKKSSTRSSWVSIFSYSFFEYLSSGSLLVQTLYPPHKEAPPQCFSSSSSMENESSYDQFSRIGFG